jgi:translation initiation factor 1
MSLTENIIFNYNNNFLNDDTVNGKVHIRINQRKSNKYITIIQDLELLISFDEKEILKYIKNNLNCNGNVTNHKEYGKILQFQGDKRYDIKNILIDIYNISESNIEVHG